MVAGNSGLNCHLSELISTIIEPVAFEETGHEVDSTDDLLSRIQCLNEKLKGGAGKTDYIQSPAGNVQSSKCHESIVTHEHLDVQKSFNTDSCKENELFEKQDRQGQDISQGKNKSFPKNDIRSFVKPQGAEKPELCNLLEIEGRIEKLRSKVDSETGLPNINDRQTASWLLDKVIGDDPIKLPGSAENVYKGQKQLDSGMAIVGVDVKSLFPSLRNVETARLAKKSILKSKVKFEGVDYQKALKYIWLVGGDTLLDRNDLLKFKPKWKGKRSDLLTIGGDSARDDNLWNCSGRTLFEGDKRRILAVVIEIAVNTVMSTHVYKFAGKFYLQRDGGPIGLRSTACLAALIMKLWDKAWVSLLAREGITFEEFLRYVDDARSFSKPLCPGIFWNGENFGFCPDKEKLDLESDISPQNRTMKEFVAAMSSLVSYLQFEGEESGMFRNDRLPTLDTEIWYDNESNMVMHSFFEKEMVPNRVLQKSTALSKNSIRASLTQEVVRRLKSCSEAVKMDEKQEILSTFGQKLINSGHSLASAQFILVHGTVKYVEMVRKSKLPKNDPDFKPLHCARDFEICNRKLRKLLAKTGWYDDNELNKKTNWRVNLPNNWAGEKPSQFKLKGMRFSTIMQVPNSKNGALVKLLSRAEPKLAVKSGYQVKMVEKSGKPLHKLFPADVSSCKCHKALCEVCSNHSGKGPSLCGVKSVVYSSICLECDAEHKKNPNVKHKGIYIGQTYRTLAERALEHRRSYRRQERSSFMFKHWFLEHSDATEAPKFRFNVIQHFKDPLSRMVKEAVLILDQASLNSKSEYKGYKIPRLAIEKSDWESKKDQDENLAKNQKLDKDLATFREKLRSIALAQPSISHNLSNNFDLSSRKRKMSPQKPVKPKSGFVTVGGVRLSGNKRPRFRLASDPQSGPSTPGQNHPEPSTSTPTHPVQPAFEPSTSPDHTENADAPDSVSTSEQRNLSEPLAENLSICLSSNPSNEGLLNSVMDELENSVGNEQIDVGVANAASDLASEDIEQIAPSEVNAAGNPITEGDTECELASEPSGSSVSRLLTLAMVETQPVCESYWWHNLQIDPSIAGTSIGKGVKRKGKAPVNPKVTKKAKLEIGVDLCDVFSNLCVDLLAQKSHTLGCARAVDLDLLALKMEALVLCKCEEEWCLACTVRGLGNLVDAAEDMETSPIKSQPADQAPAEPTPADASFPANTADSSSQVYEQKEESTVPVNAADSSNHDPGLAASSAEDNTCVLGNVMSAPAASSEVSGGRLPLGSCVLPGPALQIGRFFVFAVLDPWIGLQADHPTAGDLKAAVSSSSIFSKFLSLRSDAPVKKSLMKSSLKKKKKPKQRRAECGPTPKSSKATQRGILDYLAVVDGPMRDGCLRPASL